MATGDYCTLDEFKTGRRVTDPLDDGEITTLITVASRMVDNYCGRTFYQDASTSVRTYEPPEGSTLIVDDISTTTGLVVVDYGTTLTIGTDFDLFPTGGWTNSGEAGPYYQIRRYWGFQWFQPNKGASISVTARWGWATTPPAIKRACILQVADLLQARDNTFGVVGLEVGTAVRLRVNTLVASILAPYRRETAPGFGFA